MKALDVEQALCKLETGRTTKGIFYNCAGAIERIFGKDEEGRKRLSEFADFLWGVLKEK